MKHDEHSNFWFGFALGVCTAAACAYAFGTKQGRTIMRKGMDAAEHLAENHHDLSGIVSDIAQKFGKVKNLDSKTESNHAMTSIGSLMEKMKVRVKTNKDKAVFMKESK